MDARQGLAKSPGIKPKKERSIHLPAQQGSFDNESHGDASNLNHFYVKEGRLRTLREYFVSTNWLHLLLLGKALRYKAMKREQIEIKVNGFRSIASADIRIDGITVVTGVNGSGKSTLSKLLYHTFRISNEFDSLVKDQLQSSLYKSLKALEEIVDELRSLSKLYKRDVEIGSLDFMDDETQTIDEQKVIMLQFLEALAKLADELLAQPIEHRDYGKRVNRLIKIIDEINNTNAVKKHNSLSEDGELQINLADFIKSIELLYDRAIKKRDNRELDIFTHELQRIFSEEKVSPFVKIYEYGVLINDESKRKLLDTQSVHEVVYIDTPYMLDFFGKQSLMFVFRQGIRRSFPSLWIDLIRKLILSRGTTPTPKTIDFIATLEGEAYYSKDPLNRGFRFKRKDKQEFDLIECATGIKSLSILQLLYTNGYLDNKTLLIIDEPEAHMHPQWIVEYARIIVLLNKTLGVKFFIASHNPDFVSAIRYISESEGVIDDLSFYLAERKADTYDYSFTCLGNEISEIFKSFNIALDRIELYGTKC